MKNTLWKDGNATSITPQPGMVYRVQSYENILDLLITVCMGNTLMQSVCLNHSFSSGFNLPFRSSIKTLCVWKDLTEYLKDVPDGLSPTAYRGRTGQMSHSMLDTTKPIPGLRLGMVFRIKTFATEYDLVLTPRGASLPREGKSSYLAVCITSHFQSHQDDIQNGDKWGDFPIIAVWQNMRQYMLDNPTVFS